MQLLRNKIAELELQVPETTGASQGADTEKPFNLYSFSIPVVAALSAIHASRAAGVAGSMNDKSG